MDTIFSHAVKAIMNKDTVFLGLFLVGYYMQFIDKKEQKEFISKQQDVLIDLTASVKDIARNQDKQDSRLDRIENRIFDRSGI